MSTSGNLEGNLYQDDFNPEHSKQGDLDLAGLGINVDQREEKLRALKACMADWRPLAVPVAQFMEWTRPCYPAVIFGVNTLFFLLVWYLDLSVLSTLAILGTIVTFADGIIPVLSTTIFDQNAWTEEQGREYDALCNRILDAKQCACGSISRLKQLKAQIPRFFSIGLCGVFILAAIIFDRVNNSLLMYLISTLLLLAPGLHAKNVFAIVHQHGNQLVKKIKNKSKKQA